MTDAFELRHQPTRTGTAYVRVWPILLAVVLLAIGTAVAIALATQDLDEQQLIQAWSLVAGATVSAGYVLHRAWRTWPAASPSLVVIRMDGTGPQLRKGRYRDDTWFRVRWTDVQAVTFTPVPPPAGAAPGLARLRVLRFVPHPTADVPAGPPGGFDHLLGLPPRESVLAFVAVPSWDDDLRALLAWVRRHRPELRVDDTVPPS